jgi:hypothetical protein
MRLNKLLAIGVLACSALSAIGQTTTTTTTYWGERFRYDRESATLYNPGEFSLDLFGTWADRDRFGSEGDHWGGGLGVNFFLNRYVGIGADSYLEEWKWPYRVNGNVILRYPIDAAGLAPYIIGGGGREFKYAPQWTGHVGGGLEFRVNRHTGFFGEGRYVFPDKTPNYTLVRFGLRAVF